MKVRSVRLFSLIGISGYLFGMMLAFPVRAETGRRGDLLRLETRSVGDKATGSDYADTYCFPKSPNP